MKLIWAQAGSCHAGWRVILGIVFQWVTFDLQWTIENNYRHIIGRISVYWTCWNWRRPIKGPPPVRGAGYFQWCHSNYRTILTFLPTTHFSCFPSVFLFILIPPYLDAIPTNVVSLSLSLSSPSSFHLPPPFLCSSLISHPYLRYPCIAQYLCYEAGRKYLYC